MKSKQLSLTFLLLTLCFTSTSYASSLTGAGASFPYPLYAKWADLYKKQTGISINYQSMGSGGGIKQIKAKTVHFGASDQPLSSDELNAMGLTQFPTTISGITPVINMEGISSGQLKLSGETLAAIFLGQITKWNDARITALNADLALPDADITVVHRSDGSGTTYIFSDYLTQISPEWRDTVGAHTAVKWPIGIGGKGNSGVASYVKRIKNSIGYIEHAYAQKNNITYVQLRNQEGVFVSPNPNTFKAAAEHASWDIAHHFNTSLTNQPGQESWPICSATFILMHNVQRKMTHAKKILDFFDWAYSPIGGKTAVDLDYVPLPEHVAELIRTSWKSMVDENGNAVWQ